MKQLQQTTRDSNQKSISKSLGLREFYRTPYLAKVEVFSISGVHINSARSCDISPKGMSVMVNCDNLFIGATVVLKVLDLDGVDTMLLKAKLVYKKNHQSSLERFHVLGFEFQGVSSELHRKIAVINLKTLSRK